MTDGTSPFSPLRSHSTLQEARDAAADDAASTGGRTFPCVVFKQGNRLMISTAIPMTALRNHIRHDWVGMDEGKGVREATNRPLIPEHVRNIEAYLLQNSDVYIMPPVTLNVREEPQLYVHNTNSPTRLGYLVIDPDTKYFVTDGQHRIAAIAGHNAGRKPAPGVLGQEESFEKDGIAVQIVYEPDLAYVHQDFADAAQTKAIPASLLASYNMREPINRVLAGIVDGSFLKGRVDESAKTLPKLSNKLFLLNQVRGFVKELLVKDYAKAEQALLNEARALIGETSQQNEFIANARQLLGVLADNMTPWKEIAHGGDEWLGKNSVADYREQYVNMTATGLAIIGRVGYTVIKKTNDPVEREAYYRRLATEIDWRRSAEIWQNGIIQNNKIMTQRGPVRESASKVLAALGLDDEQ